MPFAKSRIKPVLLGGLTALALTVGANAMAALPCIMGDGYKIPSGGNVTVAPVSCGSDCYDYPNGGFETKLFCVNGVLGESDPKLTGGPVAPLVNAAEYNGYSRCTALPTAAYKQSADRKSCIRR